MGYSCKISGAGECDGCGECAEYPALYDDVSHMEIYDGEKFYDIDGTVVACENLEEWAKEYLRVANKRIE